MCNEITQVTLEELLKQTQHLTDEHVIEYYRMCLRFLHEAAWDGGFYHFEWWRKELNDTCRVISARHVWYLLWAPPY